MIYAFLAAIFGAFSMSFFALNFSIQGLNRAVIFTPIEMFSKGIEQNNSKPRFTVDEIEYYLNSYYDKTLPRYAKNYEVSYYFYNKDDHSMCTKQYCDAVEISVDAEILTYSYHRVMYYELVG